MKMHSHWMTHTLLAVLLCALVGMVSASPFNHDLSRRSLPCNHPLRLVVPSLFTHCETVCYYSDWSSWQTIQPRVRIRDTRCNESNYYYTQQRTREVLSFIGDSADCTASEVRKICYPTDVEIMIAGLGLGGSGQDYSGSYTRTRFGWSRYYTVTESVYGNGSRCPRVQSAANREVCQHLTGRRRRSTTDYHDSPNIQHIKQPIIIDDKLHVSDQDAPSSFNWKIHGSHFRQRRATQCRDNDIQRVLFVLDSSGSIGSNNFRDMKEAIAKLVPLFCKQIETALITFSSTIKLEYCFNCFKSGPGGRQRAQEAINNATYFGGMTYTGATAKCICDNILNSTCGIDPTSINCLDVVFITDGHSNDPNLEICDEIRCLHNRVGINTYAIGIGGYNHNELDCIEHNTDDFGLFEYETFQEFSDAIDDVVQRLSSVLLAGEWYSCALRNGLISPTGSPLEVSG